METCGFVLVDCSNGCGVKFEQRFANKHQKDDCAKRMTTCEFCKILIVHFHQSFFFHLGKNKIIFEEEIPHLNVCPEFKIPCPNHCSQQQFARRQVINTIIIVLLSIHVLDPTSS